MTTDEKIDWIIETLKRMEARQVELKTEVNDVQAHEPATVGSFATVNTDKKAKIVSSGTRGTRVWAFDSESGRGGPPDRLIREWAPWNRGRLERLLLL